MSAPGQCVDLLESPVQWSTTCPVGPAGAAGVAGPPGPAGTSVAYVGDRSPQSVDDRKLNANGRTVGRMPLNPGSYAVSAVVYASVGPGAGPDSDVSCQLLDQVGRVMDFGAAFPSIIGGQNAITQIIVLTGPLTISGAGTLSVGCRTDGPTPGEWIQIRIVAVQVTGFQNVILTAN